METHSSGTLHTGLLKTKESFLRRISRVITGKSRIDDDVLDQLEEVLLASDVGAATTVRIIEQIQRRVARERILNTSELNEILKMEIQELLGKSFKVSKTFFSDPLPSKPYVIMVLGVNGVGKTTTIAKLANKFQNAGKTVILGAADTFRAAAIDQLAAWATRMNIKMVRQQMGADPASVAYDAVSSAIAAEADVVIVDTAGRLHTKTGLMDELSKIRRAVQKVIPDAPNEVLLVLDASTGQNAFEQARLFMQATSVNAIALTKLDGTAKGGVVIGISDQFKIPVRYIGTGEGIDDLQLFDSAEFVNQLFN